MKAWQITLAAAFAYCCWALWSMYRGGIFAYHDLTLLNDCFANAFRGRPFWVTDDAVQHLTIHFTPTLFLLLPFFVLSRSQFLFVALGLIALYGSLTLHVWHFHRVLRDRELARGVASFLAAAWAVFLAFNVYTRAVTASAHYEPFYSVCASAALVGILGGIRLRWCALFALLAAGVRPDGGMFLGVQALSLLVLPRAQRPDRNVLVPRVLVVTGLGFLYLLLFVAIIAPAIGSVPGTRFWSHYGNTWWEVAWTVVRSPMRVLGDVATSGIPRFNASFGLLQWLAPVAALVANLPAGFFAIAETTDKRLLWWYNAAFLLPGLFVCAQAGLVRVLDWIRAWSRIWPRLRLPQVVPVAMACALIGLILRTSGATAGTYPLVPRPAVDGPTRAALERHLDRCPGRVSVATDFFSVAFVPNTLERYLLRNFQHAQVVLVPPAVSRMYLGAPSRAALLERIHAHPEFTEVTHEEEVQVFVRNDAPTCVAAQERRPVPRRQ